MSLWAEIHQIALEHPEGSPLPIAEQFLDRISHEQLVTLVADAILTARRNFVRAAEQEAFTPLPVEEVVVEGFEEHVVETVNHRQLSREQFLDLLDRTFAVGDRKGGTVRWGEATVAQHQARIQLLEANVRGLRVTIDRHRQAIALIEQEGTTCLNDAVRGMPA